MMEKDRRAQRALQMILGACALQRYVVPYHVVVTDARSARIAARFDHDGAEPLDGDLGSVGLMHPPYRVHVTDFRGECAEFTVHLLDRNDGTPIMPIIGYPTEWIEATSDGYPKHSSRA